MAAEDQAQELLMRAGEAGVRIVVDVARLGVGRLFDVLGIGVRAAGESLRHLRDTGRVSVRRLQRMGQPVTVQEVTGPHAASVARALKRAGVTFHIERSRKDGRVFLHFQGKDIQSVEHIVARLVDRLNHAAAQREPVARIETIEPKASRTLPEAQPEPGAALAAPFEKGAESNGRLDFQTVPWDGEGQIIAMNLERLGIPHASQRVGGGVVRFEYRREDAPRVADMIERLSVRTRGLDWDRFDAPERPGRNGPVKTKRQTLNDIRARAERRAGAAAPRTSPSHRRARNR